MAQTGQTSPQHSPQQQNDRADAAMDEIPLAPRWQAAIGILILGLINFILPSNLTLGPRWLLPAIELILLVPLVVEGLTNRGLPPHIRRLLALILLGVVTVGMVGAVILLVLSLSNSATKAVALLRDAVLIWASNILVFALWYWEIDGGGPLKRREKGHQAADFLFPQQADGNSSGWVPHFLDYVFLAFTAATALSPTDTFPLSRAAKFLMMLEAIISMVVVVLLAARAVNIL
jgi:uncharacterized membrane protein